MRSACRLFRIGSRAAVSSAALQEMEVNHFELAVVAQGAGRFKAALHFLDVDLDVWDVGIEIRQISRAFIWLRLGQWFKAEAAANEIDQPMLDSNPYSLLLYAIARRDIDTHSGVDPLPALRKMVVRLRDLGVGGVNLQFLEWQVARRALPAEACVPIGAGLIELFRSEHADARRLPLTLLELAEVHAQAGSDSCRALALEAARELRRGRGMVSLYLPEGLVRCAKLLESTDPPEAASLMHVARRWVQQAMTQWHWQW